MPATYGRDVALVHHLGHGLHADTCAPGILARLEPVRARGGTVLELGCGSGQLTRHLLDAGHRVIATDASPDILALARDALGPDADLRRLTLPDDPLPAADAVVSVGHMLSYLDDLAAVERALVAIARALAPGGPLALDVCDLAYGVAREGAPTIGRAEDGWAMVTSYARPSPDRFVRDITTFLPNPDGSWRRGREVHDTVLVDTARIPAILAAHGVLARVAPAFGDEAQPAGLVVVLGRKERG